MDLQLCGLLKQMIESSEDSATKRRTSRPLCRCHPCRACGCRSKFHLTVHDVVVRVEPLDE